MVMGYWEAEGGALGRAVKSEIPLKMVKGLIWGTGYFVERGGRDCGKRERDRDRQRQRDGNRETDSEAVINREKEKQRDREREEEIEIERERKKEREWPERGGRFLCWEGILPTVSSYSSVIVHPF